MPAIASNVASSARSRSASSGRTLSSVAIDGWSAAGVKASSAKAGCGIGGSEWIAPRTLLNPALP